MTGEQLVKLNKFLASVAMAALVWIGFILLMGFITEREIALAELEKAERLRQIVMYESECQPVIELSMPIDLGTVQL